jgi:hypothetical protein
MERRRTAFGDGFVLLVLRHAGALSACSAGRIAGHRAKKKPGGFRFRAKFRMNTPLVNLQILAWRGSFGTEDIG